MPDSERCTTCGTNLSLHDPPYPPCPKCGATLRTISRSVHDTITVSDSYELLQFRLEALIAFSESEREALTRFAHLREDGTIAWSISGRPPQNEQDSPQVLDLLIAFLNTGSDVWASLGKGQADEDFVVERNGKDRHGVQVTRALSSDSFYRSLAFLRQIQEEGYQPDTAAATMLQAILGKASKIPPAQRPRLILALDAYRVPMFALGVVIDAFRRLHGEQTAALGFYSVYLVGPGIKLVHQLQ